MKKRVIILALLLSPLLVYFIYIGEYFVFLFLLGSFPILEAIMEYLNRGIIRKKNKNPKNE